MSQTFETAGKIENGEVVWTETRNRVWTVRSGNDGIGLALFHVYAPTMDEARERAAENMSAISEVHKLYAERGLFTVHADDPSDVTLKAGPYDQIPAIDFDNPAVTDWTEFFPERAEPGTVGRFEVTPVPTAEEMRAAFEARHPWHCQCREVCAEPDVEVR